METLAMCASCMGGSAPSLPSGITQWYWRKHGRGSYRVMFDSILPIQKHNILVHLAIFAKKAKIKHLLRYNKNTEVPAQGFYLNVTKAERKSRYYVIPIIADDQIIGYEFWSCTYFRRQSFYRFQVMAKYVRAMMNGLICPYTNQPKGPRTRLYRRVRPMSLPY